MYPEIPKKGFLNSKGLRIREQLESAIGKHRKESDPNERQRLNQKIIELSRKLDLNYQRHDPPYTKY